MRGPNLTRRSSLGLIGAGFAAGPVATVLAAATVHVFAAASLKTALDEVVAASFEAGHVSATYAGSSLLARQILQGAPADIFISANTAWMDELAAAGLLRPERRATLLENRLVLVAPADNQVALRIAPGFPLAKALGPSGRLAMALVDAVPAGIYGREALTSLGVWAEVAPRVAQTDNARSALRLVAAAEAPFGIVYSTDAISDPRVRIVGTFPDDSHSPVRYPAALLKDAGPEAEQVWQTLTSPTALSVFAANGFLVPGQAS